MKCISKDCYNNAKYKLDFCQECFEKHCKEFRKFLESSKPIQYKYEDKK